MKKIKIWAFATVALIATACQSPMPKDKIVTKDSIEYKDASAVFTTASMVESYLQLGTALYNRDEAKIATVATTFAQVLTQQRPELVPTSSREDLKDILENSTENIQHIIASKGDLNHQVEHYQIVSQDMYDLIKLFGTAQELYKFECKRDNKPTMWLSNSKEAHNPYLGENHQPCGELIETLK